jgi:hypothetical protein
MVGQAATRAQKIAPVQGKPQRGRKCVKPAALAHVEARNIIRSKTVAEAIVLLLTFYFLLAPGRALTSYLHPEGRLVAYFL